MDVLDSLWEQDNKVFSNYMSGVEINNSVQCISYHSCCVTPRLYSSFLGSNLPTTADSFIWVQHRWIWIIIKVFVFIFPLHSPLDVSIAVRGDIFATHSTF